MLFAAAIAAIAAAAAWLPVERAVARPANTDPPVLRAIDGAGGWTASNAFITDWKPRYAGYASEINQTFEKDHYVVGLYLAYFRNQEKARELITSGNVLVKAVEFRWKQLSTKTDTLDWLGSPTQARRAEIVGPNVHLNIELLYWVEGTLTSSDYLAKALTAWSKLRGRGDDSALIVIYTRDSETDKKSMEMLHDFAAAMSPSIERSIEAAQR